MVNQVVGDNIGGFASGDVVLFCGRHPIHRRQQELSHCPWAQVGLVVRQPGKNALVFEATRLSNCPDVRRGTVLAGVQLAWLTARVEAYEGAVAVRSLTPPLCPQQAAQLATFVNAVHGLPFNDNKWEAGRAWCRRNVRSSGQRYFCSELVAAAYQHLGLLVSPPQGMPANNYIPADFSAAFADSILEIAGAALGAEIILKGSPSET